MTLFSAFLKNALSLGVAGLVEKFSYVLFIVMTARYLTKDEFGVYTLFVTVLVIGGMLGTFGTDAVVVRQVAKDPRQCREIFTNTIAINIFLNLLIWPLLIVLIHVLDYDKRLIPLMYIGGAVMMFSSIAQTAAAVIRAFQKMEIIIVSSLVYSVISLAAGWCALKSGLGIKGLAMVMVTAEGARFAILTMLVYKKFSRFSWRINLKDAALILKYAVPFALFTVSSLLLRRIDLLMLGKMKLLADVAVYGAVSKLTDFLSLISGSLIGAFFPAISAKTQSSRKECLQLFNDSVGIFSLVGWGISSIFVALAGPVLTLLFGAPYAGGTAALSWLSLAFLVNMLNGPATTLLIADGKKIYLLLWISLVAIVINVVLNFLLIPKYSYTGAAFAAFLGAVFGFVVRLIMLSDFFKQIPNLAVSSWRPMFGAVAVWGVCRIVLSATSGPFPALIIGSITYILVLGLLGEFRNPRYLPIIKRFKKNDCA